MNITEIGIEENKSLRFEKVASYRSKLKPHEVNINLQWFIELLQNKEALKSGPMMSATHNVELIDGEQVLDIEFLVAIDRKIELNTPCRYLEIFQIENAVYKRFIGSPPEIQSSYNDIISYITRRNLQQITSVYSVNVNEDQVIQGREPTIDLYVSVSKNII